MTIVILAAAALTAASCYEDTAGEGDYRNITNRRTINSWPEGRIHYSIEASFNKEEMEYLMNAMQEWSDKTTVSFIPVNSADHEYNEGEERVLRIDRTAGESHATAGYAAEPALMISTSDRMYQRYIVQLFGHVIGLLNEHQRPDRDEYIKINWENIANEALSHYAKMDNSLLTEEDFAYDTMSVMHYTRTQGSKEFGLRAFDYLYQDFDTKAHYVSDGDADKVQAIYSSLR